MSEATPSAEVLARRKLFTDALRSEEFEQGKGNLSHLKGSSIDDWEHCCLGVACIVAIRNGLDLPFQIIGDLRWYSITGEPDDLTWDNSTVLPNTVMKWYGWTSVDPEIDIVDTDGETYEYPAADVNDSKGKDFAQIADAFDAKYVHPYELPEDPSGALEP